MTKSMDAAAKRESAKSQILRVNQGGTQFQLPVISDRAPKRARPKKKPMARVRPENEVRQSTVSVWSQEVYVPPAPLLTRPGADDHLQYKSLCK